MHLHAIAAALCGALILGGCDVRTPPQGIGAPVTADALGAAFLGTGYTEAFHAPPAHVVEATGLALDTLGLRWTGVSPLGRDGARFSFEKGSDTFSFGNVGDVDVTPLPDGSTAVTLTAERKAFFEATATNSRQLADRVFREIGVQLGRWHGYGAGQDGWRGKAEMARGGPLAGHGAGHDDGRGMDKAHAPGAPARRAGDDGKAEMAAKAGHGPMSPKDREAMLQERAETMRRIEGMMDDKTRAARGLPAAH